MDLNHPFLISPRYKKSAKDKGFNPGRGDILSFNSDELFNSGEGEFALPTTSRTSAYLTKRCDFVFYEHKISYFMMQMVLQKDSAPRMKEVSLQDSLHQKVLTHSI